MSYHIFIFWSEIKQLYVAEVPELPGVVAEGDTYEAAASAAQIGISRWLEGARTNGDIIPTPFCIATYADWIRRESLRSSILSSRLTVLEDERLCKGMESVLEQFSKSLAGRLTKRDWLNFALVFLGCLFGSFLFPFLQTRSAHEQTNSAKGQELAARDGIAEQVILNLSSNWSAAFNPDARRRWERLRWKMANMGDPTKEAALMNLLADPNAVHNYEALRSNADMNELIRDEIGYLGAQAVDPSTAADVAYNKLQKGKDDADISTKPNDDVSDDMKSRWVDTAMNYRTTVITGLNTIESFRVLRDHCKMPEVEDIIDTSFSAISQTWVEDFKDFICAYRNAYKRQVIPAWNVLLTSDSNVIPWATPAPANMPQKLSRPKL